PAAPSLIPHLGQAFTHPSEAMNSIQPLRQTAVAILVPRRSLSLSAAAAELGRSGRLAWLSLRLFPWSGHLEDAHPLRRSAASRAAAGLNFGMEPRTVWYNN